MKKKEKNRLNALEFLRKEESRMKKLTVFVLLVLLPTVSFAQKKRVLVYDYQPGLKEIFTEPFEIMAIYNENGKTITITSHLEHKVNGSLNEIEYYLNIVGSDLESAKFIIHNHLVPYRWSLKDKKFYHDLKKKGFKGQFILYFPWSKSVRYMEEPNKTDTRENHDNPKERIS